MIWSDFAMTTAIDIDELICRFRIASRELYNNFFMVANPYENDGWDFEQRFSDVEDLLFRKLVLEPASINGSKYGDLQSMILVQLRRGEFAPIRLNREIKSGYWDYPISEVTKDANLFFLEFFDWDQLDYRDNQYVLVQVDHWPSHPETVGKRALIESRHVRFARSPG
jgi:hypothetical protein